MSAHMFAIILLSTSFFPLALLMEKEVGVAEGYVLIEGSDHQVLSEIVGVQGLVEVFLTLPQTILDGFGGHFLQTAHHSCLQFFTVEIGGVADCLFEFGHEPIDGVELVGAGGLEVEPDPVFS